MLVSFSLIFFCLWFEQVYYGLFYLALDIMSGFTLVNGIMSGFTLVNGIVSGFTLVNGIVSGFTLYINGIACKWFYFRSFVYLP